MLNSPQRYWRSALPVKCPESWDTQPRSLPCVRTDAQEQESAARTQPCSRLGTTAAAAGFCPGPGGRWAGGSGCCHTTRSSLRQRSPREAEARWVCTLLNLGLPALEEVESVRGFGVYVLHHREDVENILFCEGGLVPAVEVVLLQQDLGNQKHQRSRSPLELLLFAQEPKV